MHVFIDAVDSYFGYQLEAVLEESSMSYPVFLVVALAGTMALGALLAGPLLVLCIFGFWIAHYFFLEWRKYEAALKDLSDFELDDILNGWVGHQSYYSKTTDLKRIRASGNKEETRRALSRVIDIYNEKIERCERASIMCDNYKEKRDLLISDLDKLK